MNTTQLKRLAIGLAAAIGAWAVLALVRRAPSDRNVALPLPALDSLAVDTIAFFEQRDTLVFSKSSSNSWRSGDLPASSVDLGLFIHDFNDTTRWSELAAENVASHARLGVSPDSGRRIRISSHGKTMLDLVVGNGARSRGVYARRFDENAVYAVHGLTADALMRPGTGYLDKRVGKALPDSVATIDVTRGSAAYSLKRTGKGNWSFGGGTPADSASVVSLLERYRDINAADVARGPVLRSLDFTKPSGRTRLLDGHGRPLLALLFDSTATGLWMRRDSGGPVFRLDAYAFASMAPAESVLHVKRTKKK